MLRWSSLAVLIAFLRWLISLQTLIPLIALSFTLTGRNSFTISFTLFSSPLNHFSELLMLSDLFFFFLFLIKSSLFTLLLETTSCPCQSVSFLIFENWFVVYILDSWNLGNNGFSVMWDFFGKLVVLHVNNSNTAHFLQYFRQKFFSLYFVIRDI